MGGRVRDAMAVSGGVRRLAEAPFDYDRKLMSVLVEDSSGQRRIITKGAPEAVLSGCREVPTTTRAALDAQFLAGRRVVGIAVKDAGGAAGVGPEDEHAAEPLTVLIPH